MTGIISKVLEKAVGGYRAEALRRLSGEERKALLGRLTVKEKAALYYTWEFWAREKQIAPGGEWFIWLLLSGRGGGKTRTGAELVRKWAKEGYSPIALVGQTKADVRDTMVEVGESSLLKVSPPWFTPEYEPSKRRLTWPNGVQGIIYSGDEPDQLRGPQHMKCFVAGTLIATAHGERPIETIKEGDYVLTRRGYHKVVETICRYAEVGRVKFSNGSELVATAQHPVLQLNGWMRISALTQGGKVCTGERLLTDILQPISEARKFINTGGFGNRQTALFPKVLKFITRMKINSITILVTYFSKQGRRIFACMTELGKELWSSAKIVGQTLLELEITPVPQFAGVVGLSEQRQSVNQIESAKYAESLSNQESTLEAKGISVASVVSTWEHVGQARVYNLTVEDQPEYIANGIIVHNCWVDELAKFQQPEQTWDNLMLGLRIGDKPQVVVTTTPRPMKIIKDLLVDKRCVVTRGHTLENKANLAPEFLSYVLARYQGTKLGRQELAGEVLSSLEGLVYDAFKSDMCVIPRFAISPEWPRYFGMDFGRVNTAAVWYAMEPETGFLYLYRTYKAKASVIEHAMKFRELSRGEVIRRRVGGNLQEQEARDGYQLAGWPVYEPKVSNDKWERIRRVNSLHAQNKIYVFSDLNDYIDEKMSFSWEIDKEDNLTGKIHGESEFHLMFAESYICSEFDPVSVGDLDLAPVARRV